MHWVVRVHPVVENRRRHGLREARARMYEDLLREPAPKSPRKTSLIEFLLRRSRAPVPCGIDLTMSAAEEERCYGEERDVKRARTLPHTPVSA